jgi:hypothetical protein
MYALCSLCEDMGCYLSVQYNSSTSEIVQNRTCTYTLDLNVVIKICVIWPLCDKY